MVTGKCSEKLATSGDRMMWFVEEACYVRSPKEYIQYFREKDWKETFPFIW